MTHGVAGGVCDVGSSSRVFESRACSPGAGRLIVVSVAITRSQIQVFAGFGCAGQIDSLQRRVLAAIVVQDTVGLVDHCFACEEDVVPVENMAKPKESEREENDSILCRIEDLKDAFFWPKPRRERVCRFRHELRSVFVRGGRG